MNDLDRLEDRINRLSEPPGRVTGRSRLLTEGSVTPSEALRREIEETQLPRRLVFGNDRSESLALVVRAGRILAVLDAAPFAALGSVSVGRPLHAAVPADRTVVGHAISGFLREATRLTVRSDRDVPGISPAVTGVGWEDFHSRLTATHTDGGSVPCGLDTFVANCREFSIASIQVRDSRLGSRSGDPGRLAGLERLAQSEIGAQCASEGSAPGNLRRTCVILCSTGAEGEAILTGSHAKDLVFMAFPVAKLNDVIGLWRG